MFFPAFICTFELSHVVSLTLIVVFAALCLSLVSLPCLFLSLFVSSLSHRSWWLPASPGCNAFFLFLFLRCLVLVVLPVQRGYLIFQKVGFVPSSRGAASFGGLFVGIHGSFVSCGGLGGGVGPKEGRSVQGLSPAEGPVRRQGGSSMGDTRVQGPEIPAMPRIPGRSRGTL